MAKQKTTKRALLGSVLALVLCLTMLIGTTFAWFTDSVTSANNKIFAGNLKIDLEVLEKDNTTWTSVKNSKAPIFNYENWEPGYTEVKILKVENEGSLALKWKATFTSEQALTELANVIDVYVKTDVTSYPTNRTEIEAWKKVGTLADFAGTLETTTVGTLEERESATLGLAFKMQETAGNTYQGMNLGGAFDICIVATQLTSEEDSFDNQYDANATLDFTPVSNINELKAALKNKKPDILLTEDVSTNEELVVDYDVNIDGEGGVVSRADGYTGNVFSVKANARLTLNNITLDGGAVWSGRSTTLVSNTANLGITATGNLIVTSGNGTVVLNEDTILQNNAGASAVSLATRGGGTLTLNGAQIIHNSAAGGGAIWAGGNVIINEGSKINYNTATSIGGAIRSVNGAGTITMNGGEMNYNYSASNGGAIWGGNNNKHYFNGGEMAYNTADGAGGAIWTGTYEKYYISGEFELHDNAAAQLGGAIRFCDHSSLEMTGGKVYNNTVAGVNSAFYLNNNSATVTGGEIADNFSYSGGLGFKAGKADINGEIAFNLSTNHNTVYLAEEFNGFSFTVNEADEHFGNFNFQPEDGYVYNAGDETKLNCQNSGYTTYWDAGTGTFRLQAE